LRGELVLVNDSSPDDTWAVIEGLARVHHSLVAIDLMTNEGQALATLCGIAHARGRFVATMDDDLQQWPEELGKLLDALKEHPEWDAAVGSWHRDHESMTRRVGSWCTRGSIDTCTERQSATGTRRFASFAGRSRTRSSSTGRAPLC